ncbi:hypothetical protein [Natronolimnohabitans innermongolicus]|uniref:Uncharacterized protein n=1 Tax=Natronolimnohabitans innermongolicus JCM 12255 TaxID=1227499 RepID=L9X5G0_9EURY|nr:hypothetical protein [Natronolimnohabitans innermongolicus]ELY55833.1 hypothetical protein C493_10158 [Natronolimnohabitans innermongolicus JCM 12255]
MDDHQRLTALSDAEADALAEAALESESVERLETYLEESYDASLPSENRRAFERDDGVRAVTFESDPEPESATRPALAVTVHFEDESVVRATAERHGPDVDGTVELVFPSALAPRPEAAVRDIVNPDGGDDELEVEVTVDESDAVTSYTIEL